MNDEEKSVCESAQSEEYKIDGQSSLEGKNDLSKFKYLFKSNMKLKVIMVLTNDKLL